MESLGTDNLFLVLVIRKQEKLKVFRRFANLQLGESPSPAARRHYLGAGQVNLSELHSLLQRNKMGKVSLSGSVLMSANSEHNWQWIVLSNAQERVTAWAIYISPTWERTMFPCHWLHISIGFHYKIFIY